MVTFGFSMVSYHRFVRNFVWKQSAKFHTKMFYRSGEKRDFVKTCWTKNPNSGLMCLRFSLKSHKIHVIKEFKVSCVRCAILNGFQLFKRSADLKTFACLCVARCGTRPRLPVSRILNLRTGNKFSNPKWLLRSKQSTNHQISLTRQSPDENITEKNRLMAEDPNNLPSSLLGNAIDFR